MQKQTEQAERHQNRAGLREVAHDIRGQLWVRGGGTTHHLHPKSEASSLVILPCPLRSRYDILLFNISDG